MDIDAASTFRAPRTPEQKFEALFRTVCMAQRVCFRCLQRTSPPDHIDAYNCPNMGVLGAACKKFVEQYQNAVPQHVAEISFGIRPPGESCTRRLPLYPEGPPSPPQIPQHPSWNWAETVIPAHGNDNPAPPANTTRSSNPIGFDEPEDESEVIPVATVWVRLDVSKAGRILIPVSFRTLANESVIASVLVDTGSMANFISDRFIQENRLPSQKRKTAIQCVGFDGQPGVGGTVTHNWAGKITLSAIDDRPVQFNSTFGITRLGSVDAIFSLPWLDRQSWSASGSVEHGHRFTLGLTQVFVIDSLDLEEGLEG